MTEDYKYSNFVYFSYLVCQRGIFERVSMNNYQKDSPCKKCVKKLDPDCVIKSGNFRRYFNETPKENAMILLMKEKKI